MIVHVNNEVILWHCCDRTNTCYHSIRTKYDCFLVQIATKFTVRLYDVFCRCFPEC